MNNWYIVLIFIIIIAIAILFAYGFNPLSKVGGFFTGGKADKDETHGFFYAKDEELDNVTFTGRGLIKNCKIKGNLDANGFVEIKDSSVAGKTKVSGNLSSVATEFKDIDLNGTGDIFKGSANKIAVCGKLKVKSAKVDEIKYKEKCEVGTMSMPYIRIKGSQVDKVSIPSELDESQIVSRE